MRDRSEAVFYLQSRGCGASARDWALGESICVWKGEDVIRDGIKTLNGVVYLYPFEGRWRLEPLECRPVRLSFGTLDEAVGEAELVAGLGREALQARYGHLLPHRDNAAELAAAEAIAARIRVAMEGIGHWDAPAPKVGMHLWRSPEEMRRVWHSHGGREGEMPEVDFDTFMVIAIFCNAGSYRRAPAVVRVEPQDGAVIVEYRYTARPWELINPYCLLRAPRMSGEPRFVRVEE